MESLTKNKQSIETINEMVHKAFNKIEALEVIELTEGFFNVAYMIKLSDEREVILKIAPQRNSRIMTHEKNIMFAEADSMKMVKEKTVVPVPKILYYDNSHSICEADYFFMTKLSGASFSSLHEELNDTEKAKINFALGQLDAQINCITGQKFGYYGQPDKQGKNWFEVFSSIINDVIHDAQALKVDMGVEHDTIRKLLQKNRAAFQEVTTPKLVHWDLWAGNVFVENAQITGLIDFERCLWADELMEVGFRPDFYDENFFKGYGIVGLTENQKIRARWYDFYLYAIQSIEGEYRSYENKDLYNYAVGKIKEVIELIEVNQ